MRVMLAAGVVLCAVAMPGPARAIEYPWCVHYNMNGDSKNCGFVSWEQCMATARGAGGFCVQNPFYVAAHAADRTRATRRKPRT